MPTPRRQQFIYSQALWIFTTIFVLAVLDALSLELVFVVSFIGFLVLVELTAPVTVTPQWRTRLTWLIGIGLFVFGAIVLWRIIAILPPSLVPDMIPGGY